MITLMKEGRLPSRVASVTSTGRVESMYANTILAVDRYVISRVMSKLDPGLTGQSPSLRLNVDGRDNVHVERKLGTHSQRLNL